MDFAAALANLEKSAQQASRRGGRSDSTGGGGGEDRRRGRSSDHNNNYYDNRRNQRPRHDSVGSGGSFRSGGGGGRGGHHPDGGRNHHHRHHHSSNNNNNNNNNPLEAMQRFGYRVVPPYRPLPPPTDESLARPKHIALLAITIDELPYEHIWRAWAAGADTGGRTNIHVSLLCHAKFPNKVTSPWLKRRLLTKPPVLGRGKSFADPVYHSHSPEWGSVQITRGMIDLLAAAMEIGRPQPVADGLPDREVDVRFSRRRYWMGTDINGDDAELPKSVPPIDKFIFISETCLPVTSLEDCVDALFSVKAEEEPKEEPVVADKSEDATAVAATTADETTATVPATKKRLPMNPYEVSWVNARSRNTPGTPKNKYERDQFCDIHRMIPQHCRWKADQWLALSRPHADAILGIDQHMRVSDQLWNSFSKINASDEMYFPTALAVLGILKEDTNLTKDTTTTTTTSGHHQHAAASASNSTTLPPQQIWKRPLTYTDWSEGMRNPATFVKGATDLQKVVKRAQEQGCLLARKFSPFAPNSTTATGQITVEEWKRIVLGDESTVEK